MSKAKEPTDTLRIIDANLNRTGEGLRVIEEIARMLLNNKDISARLKTLRHELVHTSPAFQGYLVESRDASADVGRDTEVAGEDKTKDMESVLVANSRRVQESLRVLEEMAKTTGVGADLDADRFKQARFELYSLEQEILFLLSRQEKVKLLNGLYVVVDGQWLQGHSHLEIVRQAIRGGARTIQFREKTMKKKDLIPLACQIREICGENGVLFIVNDHLDVALATDADGLHIGQDDLPVSIARRLLRRGQLLGCSAATVEEARVAQAEGADYLGVGAIFPTSSKAGIDIIGPGKLREIRNAVHLPLVAIGGITVENVAEVMAAGATAAAVISAVAGAASPEKAAREIVKRIEAKQ
jgi:thiamine-phosphate pyrophosphorylase